MAEKYPSSSSFPSNKGDELPGSVGGSQQGLQKDPLDSPQICRLRDHLHKRYKRFNVGREGKAMEFVRLAVLEDQLVVPSDSDSEGIQEKLTFLEKYRCHGTEEGDIKGYIDANELLRKINNRMRVVYGQPGIKTKTLLTHVCGALARKEAVTDYDVVFYAPLKDKRVFGAKNLQEMLSYFTSVDEKLDLSEVCQALVDSREKQILFIFDEMDEDQELLTSQEDSILMEILEGLALPQADVIVSSYPGSFPFHKPQCSTSYYEMHGFDEASMRHYAEYFFQTTPERAGKLMEELHSRPDLMGGARIPMNLHIFCSIYEGSELPPTMTDCFKKFLCNVVKGEYMKCGVVCQVDPSLNRLPPNLKGLFESLGVLAYKGMMRNPPVFVFKEDDIRRAFPTLSSGAVIDESIFNGLLHRNSHTIGYEDTNAFKFSHITNHEFFAAYHICQLPEDDQLKILREVFTNPTFAVIARFYSGLTGLSTPGVASLICPSNADHSISSPSSLESSFSLPSECSYDEPNLLHLFLSLFESQNSQLTQSIVQHLDESFEFGLFLTSHDTLAISYCLSKCTHLRNLSFTKNFAHLPLPLLPHLLPILKANSNLQSLKLHLDNLSSPHAASLVTMTGVEELSLTVEETTLSALAAIFHSMTIKNLRLRLSSDFSPTDSDNEHRRTELTCSVAENATLRKLFLHGPPDYLTAVLHGVATGASVEELKLFGIYLPEDRRHDVAEALAACVINTKLRKVDMWHLPYLPVMEALTTREAPLAELEIWSLPVPSGSQLPEEYLKEMESTVARIKVAKLTFSVHNNARMCDAVSMGLGANKSLQEVILRGVPAGKKKFVQSKLSSVKTMII